MNFKIISIWLCLVLSADLYAQNANDTIHWNESKLLTWNDFKGAPIEGIGLAGEAFCMNLANFEKVHTFKKTTFIVIAVFDRTKSWINLDSKTSTALHYFQAMFNIYEVHARALRKDLSTSHFKKDPTQEFQAKYNSSMTNLLIEFNQFRQETKMGLDIIALNNWKVKLESELKAFDLYKR